MNPNVLICSVGTEIFYRTADGTLVPDQAWEAYLDQGWDRSAVESIAAQFPQLKQQVGSKEIQLLCNGIVGPALHSLL